MKKSAIILLSLIFVFLACGKAEKQAETPALEEEKVAVEPETEAEAEVEEGMSVEEKMATKPPVWGSIKRAKNPVVVMETNYGSIELELYWKEAPKTAENFLYLVNKGYYDGLTFHRHAPNFVIQGGDPLGNGTGGPGYRIPDEPTKKNHIRGAVGMAKSGPNTAGSQFYICLKAAPHLDKDFTVFAHVINGMDTVDKITQVPTVNEKPQEEIKMIKVYEKK
jgi:cyclophilin family peptidyl-prolyl cis-trans isomerase